MYFIQKVWKLSKHTIHVLMWDKHKCNLVKEMQFLKYTALQWTACYVSGLQKWIIAQEESVHIASVYWQLWSWQNITNMEKTAWKCNKPLLHIVYKQWLVSLQDIRYVLNFHFFFLYKICISRYWIYRPSHLNYSNLHFQSCVVTKLWQKHNSDLI